MPWGQTGGHADNTEAVERTLAIAVRYALQPAQLASAVADNAILTGALAGAQTGFSGIPQRFLDGLEDTQQAARGPRFKGRKPLTLIHFLKSIGSMMFALIIS